MSSAKKTHAPTDEAIIAKRDQGRDTRARLEALLEENPKLTPKELSEALDVSVARIHVLAERLNRKWIVRGRWHKV